MIVKTFYVKKAIPAVMAGIAFFLAGCQPKVPVSVKMETWENASKMRLTAEDYLETEQYEKALALLKKIAREYPDYNEIPLVEYQIARSYYLLGEYEISSDNSLRWVEKYPGHSARADVMLLLGEAFEALGNRPQAFYWYLEAEKQWVHDPRQEEIDGKLEGLIAAGGIEDIDRMKVYAAGTHYAPMVRRQRANIFLEQDELEKAREVAMAMIQDTQDESSVSAGMELLARIEEEMSVKKGRVGCLLPLSGPFAIYGEQVLNGIQLGIFSNPEQGSNLELVIRDTQGNPEYAVAGLEDLAHNEKVIAVIGPLSRKTAAPVAKRAQELGVPIITLTQKEGITDEGNMIFRNFLTPSREVKTLLDPGMIEMGLRRFGILYPDDSYGRFYMNLFWDRVEEIGGIVTAVESYEPGKTDFSEQIKKMTGVYYPKPKSMIDKMKEMRPPEEEESKIYGDEPEPFIDFDAVFLPDNFETVALIAPQLPYNDVQDVLLMGTSLWQSPELIKLAGDYVQGAIFPSGFFEKSGEPGVRAFVEAYKGDFGSAPGMLAAVGYDTIRLLNEILQLEDVHTRKGARNELFKVQDYKGVTGDLQFDEQGELTKEPLLLTVSGRRMKLVRTLGD